MTVGILVEKDAVAKNFAQALGGRQGNFEGTDYVIVHAAGHVFEFVSPDKMVSKDLSSQVKRWDTNHLPWDHRWFSWNRSISKGRSGAVNRLRSGLSGVDEIAIATDIDPTGEGDLIAWEIINELGLTPQTFSRMEFADEAVPSVQKAFRQRRRITSQRTEGEFLKAYFRSKFDFLTMQSTRTATCIAEEQGFRIVLNNGRLKSAIISLLGDQFEACKQYKRIPMYSVRFTDDKDVVYTNPEAQTYPHSADVPLGNFRASSIVKDSETVKKTPPPKLLELSGLTSILSRKGYTSAAVTATYQQMYHDQVVSYPRTADKFVSSEQFNEMLPLVDKIAAVVGVDPKKLTRRTPRKTHVREGGAHGANRPGVNVPASLSAVAQTYGKLGKDIYEILAKNYLTMLAEDYEFVQHKGHVKDFPEFVGSVNVPKVLGWRDVFVRDDNDEDDDLDDETGEGLGSQAEPMIHEGFPPKPATPTVSWLMKQLEKENVGTGATRVSTHADMEGAKKPQIKSKSGKIEFTDAGKINYIMTRGTRIADLSLTNWVYDNMEKVANGDISDDDALSSVGKWIADDISIMRNNARKLPKDLGAKYMSEFKKKEKVAGTFNGEDIVFNREWGGHRFSDEEVTSLLAGETVSFTDGKKKNGEPMGPVSGKLGKGSFNGREFFGFQLMTDGHKVTMPDGRVATLRKVWGANDHWSGHEFTDEEITLLGAGEPIEFDAIGKSGKKYTARGVIGDYTFNGKTNFGFHLDFNS